jgi:carbonic anhydrase/acetyltransferase-like protein (isoleucine patch superfamily)
MPIIRPFAGKAPKIAGGVFIAENATIIGDVTLEAGANVWYGAVLRADVGFIHVGEGANIQDLCCIHMTTGMSNVEIGKHATLGHSAIVHGAKIGEGTLVGMGAIVLDNAEVGPECLIAAGSVVTPRTVVPARSLVRGAPAKAVRLLEEFESQQGRLSALHYIELAKEHM